MCGKYMGLVLPCACLPAIVTYVGSKKDKVDMERGVGKKKQEPPVFWSSFLFGLVRLVDFSSQASASSSAKAVRDEEK